MLKRILYVVILSCVLVGCGKKEAEAVQEDVAVEREPANEVQEEDLTKKIDDLEKKIAELEEKTEEDAGETSLSEEESEIDNEDLESYLESLYDITYAQSSKDSKTSYYAEDIDQDGFPEAFTIRYDDITASVQDLKVIAYAAYPYLDKGKTIYGAIILGWQANNVVLRSRKNTERDPEGGVIEFSYTYTPEGTNILTHTYTAGAHKDRVGSKPYDELEDKLYVYKNNELLRNGSRTKSHESETSEAFYIMYTSDGKIYYDEEYYESLDIGTYDKTLTFTADCGWFTLDEALEHLGEFPEK